MREKIFIGVAWPYVNGPLHIGHLAGAYLGCDYFARYHRIKGNEVLMVSGSDMHGTPTTVVAEQEGVEPIVVAERYHKQDRETFKALGVTFDIYTKTSTANHRRIVQDVFLTLLKKGHLFRGVMKQAYCPKCKKFLPDRYVEGECPHCHFNNARGDQCDQCGKTLDPLELISPRCKQCGGGPTVRETEHFFLNLPYFEKKLKQWVNKQKHWRKNVREFTLGWLREGLKPRPITRDMAYGVTVPLKGFQNKVIYVWFEAVVGYLSAAIEWAEKSGDLKKWRNYWYDPKCKHYYFIGKDNIPFHTIIWPSILLGYDEQLQLPYDIPANQFLTLEGRPMSKSRGWYIDADYLLNKYGADLVRYYFATNDPEAHDVDFSWQQFVEQNNAQLVGTLGNFVHRTLVFISQNFDGKIPAGVLEPTIKKQLKSAFDEIGGAIEKCHFQRGITDVFSLARFGNKYFDEARPWATVGQNKKTAGQSIYNCIQIINALKILFYPFMPFAAERLHAMLGQRGTVKKNEKWQFAQIPPGRKLRKPTILFKKLNPTLALEELEQLKSGVSKN